jgi:hypothetical protein
MTERERRQLLRNHSNVQSWRVLFQTAMSQQEEQPARHAAVAERPRVVRQVGRHAAMDASSGGTAA